MTIEPIQAGQTLRRCHPVQELIQAVYTLRGHAEDLSPAADHTEIARWLAARIES